MKKYRSLLVVGGISLIGLCLYKMKIEKRGNSFQESIEKAGIPDQMDIDTLAQIENSKMVSEGSQYGVQYFNEFAEDKM